MSVLTPTVSLSSLDRLFRLLETCNRRISGKPRYPPSRAENPSLNLRRVLADSVAEIAKLKRLFRENANAAQSLRVELLEAKAENDSLRRELIEVRAQAVTLRLDLFDADQRLETGRIEKPRNIHPSSSPCDRIAALIELKRIFAKRYHPNSVSISNGPHERAIRTEIFKEFWGDIATVEAKYTKSRLAPDQASFS